MIMVNEAVCRNETKHHTIDCGQALKPVFKCLKKYLDAHQTFLVIALLWL